MKLSLLFVALSITSVSIAQKDTTSIALTLNTEITGYSNVIYCSSIKLLWKELTSYLGEQPIPKEKHLKIAELNKVTSNYNSPIEDKFWFAKVGLLKSGIVDTIKKAYKNKFNIDWSHTNDANVDLLGVTYLQKNIDFYGSLSHDFPDFKFKDSVHVKCFGLEHGWANPKYKVQLKIHDFKNEDDFIFQIGCNDSIDEVYFAKIPPEKNLKATYDEVMRRVNKNNLEYIADSDELQIPFLKFNIDNRFEEFQNIDFANKKLQQLELRELSQHIRFDLNQNGIRLTTQVISSFVFGINEEPRIYAFDQPFLIILKRKGTASPYFLYWVENSAHMRVVD